MSPPPEPHAPTTADPAAGNEGRARLLAERVAGAARPHLALERPLRVLDLAGARACVYRFMAQWAPLGVIGVADPDPRSVAWAARTHPAQEARGLFTFSVLGRRPPTSFASSSFDLVYTGEAFASLGQDTQQRWICELRRIARCEAILVIAARDGGAACARYLNVMEQLGALGDGATALVLCQRPRGLVL